jgi:predicted SAM-dependent methyltransferase
MKLHLGCGQKYLEGYINVDYPSSEHSVQEKSVADIHADITQLSYPASSVDEVRLHHVFEHFTRPVACGLISAWRSWLKPGGILHIEVPDFQKTAFMVLNPFSNSHSKSVALRHIFGSQEAHWAVHYEGWTANKLTNLLKNFGFEILQVKNNSWKGTYNFEVIARKNDIDLSKIAFENKVKDFLSDYLVDSSPGELKLLSVWMNEYKIQVSKCEQDE